MNDAETSEDNHAPDDTEFIFTEQFRRRNRIIASVAVILASAAPFAIGLFAITYLVSQPTNWVAAAIMFAAFIAAGLFTWLVQNRIAFVGNRWLRTQLRQRLSDSAVFAQIPGTAPFVGFAPGEEILTWSGETDLDVGFFHLSDGGAVFVGDRFTWTLKKDRIDRVDLIPAPTGLRRVVVHWHAPRQAGRSFTIGAREASSLREADRQTISLFKRMRRWLLRQPEEKPDPVPAVGYPPIDTYDGRPIDRPAAGWCAVTISMMLIIVLTTWYLVQQMLANGYYYHAALWTGFVFVTGTVFTRCVLHYLQATSTSPEKNDASQ